MLGPMKVTVVLPAYNEERDLPILLERLGSTLTNANLQFQIIVVDDGSQDRTADVARDAARRWPVEIVSHSQNQGLGGAVRTGLTEAMRDDGAVILMDSDNSHDPALILPLLEKLGEGLDVVIASRFARGGGMIGVSIPRRILSYSASFAMRFFIGYPGISDYSSGYRAYRASALRLMRDTYGTKLLEENGFACMLELLVKLKNINGLAGEIPLMLRYDLKLGKSKMRVVRTVLRYFMVLRRVRVAQEKTWPQFDDAMRKVAN